MINLKNLSKRGLALCLSILMCMGMLNLTVLAADDSPYACGLEEHIHTDECYEIVQVSGDPVCGQETGEGAHEHSEECYALELTCGLEEAEGHTHSEDCYTTEIETVEKQVLTCGLEEAEGHTHSEDCYTTEIETVEKQVLTCETEESEGHSHGDGCYSSQIVCGLEETEGHEHSDACYETETMQVLICGKEEHTHTAECLAAEPEQVPAVEPEQVPATEPEQVPAEEEVPADVQAFLDAVARIPSEITLEDADAIMAAMDAWEALGWRNADREDVQEANDIFTAAFMRLLELEEAPEASLLASNSDLQSKLVGGAGWGHPAGSYDSYVSGVTWSKAASASGHYMFANGNQVVYCIEPGVALSSGNSSLFSQAAESDNIWTTISGGDTTLATQMQNVLGLILQYGYQGDFQSTWGKNSDGSDQWALEYNNLCKAVATQILVWEVVTKQRNLTTFEYKTPGSDYTAVKDLFGQSHLMYDGLFQSGGGQPSAIGAPDSEGAYYAGTGDTRWGWYQHIAYQVRQALNNTDSAQAANGSTYELNEENSWSQKIDGFSGYTVLNVSNSEVSATVNAKGRLVLSTDARRAINNVTITLQKQATRQNVLVWTDGKYGSGTNNKQDTITWGGNTTINTSVQVKVNVKAPTTGSLVVQKNINASGYTGSTNATFEFTVQGPSYPNGTTVTVTTSNGTGSTTLNDLKHGSYTVTEKSTSATTNYTIGANQTVTVEAGKTVNATITNTRKVGSLVIGKTLTDNIGTAQDDPGTWTFTVQLTNGVGTYNGATASRHTVTVKTGETATITNIPVGTTYTVIETKDTVCYTTTGEVTSAKTIVEGDNNSVQVTNTRKYADLTVTKAVTYNDQQSKAPNAEDEFKITVKVGNSIEPQMDGIRWDGKDDIKGWPSYVGNGLYTFIVKDGTSATLSNIPTGISYEVVQETMPEGYTHQTNNAEKGTLTQNTNITVNNRYFDSVTGEIEGYKDWGNVPEELWPDFITVELTRSSKAGVDTSFFETATVTAPEDGSTKWSYSFGELPLYAAEGDPYTYSVKETGISYGKDAAARLAKYLDTLPGTPKAFAHIDVDADKGLFIIRGTNSVVVESSMGPTIQWETLGAWSPTYHTDSDGKLVIRNSWLGAEDIGEVDFQVKKVDAEDDKPLSDAKFSLYKASDLENLGDDGEMPEPFRTGTTDETGFATFSKLPGGEYILMETTAPEGHLLNPTVWTVTVGKTTLEKVEEQSANGSTTGWQNTWLWESLAGQLTFNITKSTFLKDDVSGVGTLTVSDDRIKGYVGITKIVDLDSVDVDTLDLTHEFSIYRGQIKDIKSDLSELTPVDIMTVTSDGKVKQSALLDYGCYTIVETTPGTHDSYTWNNVEFNGGKDGSQSELAWSTDEDGNPTIVTAYEVQIVEDGETVAVTAENFYERKLDPLAVSKTVTGGRGQLDREWHFEITLTAPESYVHFGYELWNPYKTTTTSIVKDAEGNLPAAVEGELELMTPLEYAAQKAAAEASAAPGSDEFDEEAFISGFKADAENQSQYPDTEDGKEIRVAVVTLKHGETITIKDLPVGVAYKVVEVEANTDGYSTSATTDGTNVAAVGGKLAAEGTILHQEDEEESNQVAFTNYRPSYSSEPITINITVNKVWVGDDEETRPDSITVVLYRDGLRYSSAELSESNSWSYSWAGLSENYTWTVGEPTVPEGYTSEVTQDGSSFTITNTFEEETTEEETPEEETPEEETFEEEEIPDEGTPLAEFPDEDVPLADLVDDPLEIFDDEVPLAEMPDENVPLAAVPATGDNSRTGLWAALCGLSLMGIIALLGKKRKDKEA